MGKLFVFDMDGVVLDSMPLLTELAVGLMQSNYEISREQAHTDYKRTTGYPFCKQLDLIFPGSPTTNQYMSAVYEECHSALASFFKLSPMVEMVLDSLVELQMQTALVSSTRRSILKKTKAFHLPFTHFGGLEKSFDKRAQILRVMNLSDVGPDEKVLFGDSESDRTLANELGFKFYMVKTPAHFAITVSIALSRMK